MTKKQIRILIITFIIIALIVFIVFLITNVKEEIDNNIDEKLISEDINNSNNNVELEAKITEEPVIQEKKEDPINLKIKTVARNFAERYGTWSTDNKDENFKSAEIYASSRMKIMIGDFILDNEKLSDDYTDFYGVTAKALNVKILNSDNTSANLNVAIQQIETSGENLDEDINYKNLNLELIKYNDDWLVDYAEWE